MTDPRKKYTIFRSIEKGNRFFTLTNFLVEDQTKLFDGTVAYEILGYADTIKEAQIFLFGYATTLRDD